MGRDPLRLVPRLTTLSGLPVEIRFGTRQRYAWPGRAHGTDRAAAWHWCAARVPGLADGAEIA